MTKIMLAVIAVAAALLGLLGLFWAGYAKLRYRERFDADGHDLEIDRDIAEYQAQKEAAAHGKAD